MTRKLIIRGKQSDEISLRDASRKYLIPVRTISGWYLSGSLKGRRSGQYVLVNLRQLVQLKNRREEFLRLHGHVRGFRVARKKRT